MILWSIIRNNAFNILIQEGDEEDARYCQNIK